MEIFVSGFGETCAASRYGWVVWRLNLGRGSKWIKWTNVSASSDMKTFQNLQSFTLCTQGPVSLARVEELCAEAEEGHSVPGEGSLRAIAVEQMKA